MLRANPGFTIVAVVTVAIGVGVNTGIFTVLNTAAFRPLNLPTPILVTIAQTFEGRVHRNVHGMPSLASYSEYRAYRDDSHVLSGILAYAPYIDATLGGDMPRALVGTLASCNCFDVLELWRAPARIVSALAGLLGFVALLLACTGVFGTVAYAVNRRVREIGIRVALGAVAADVLRLVMKQTMRPVLIGLGLGLASAAALSTVLSSVLVGISPRDPLSFAAAATVLGASAFGAAYWPARRALNAEPTTALRHE
ncbi:MAG TPA: FtsX-like permease family protein [Vicinamibacterales bacterium]